MSISDGSGPGGTPLDWDRQIYKDFQDALLKSIERPLAEVERWSWLTLVLAALSTLTVLAGAATAIIVVLKWPPNERSDSLIIMSILSNMVALLTTTANIFWNRQLKAARNELSDRRSQIDHITSRLFRRLFGDSGEFAVVTFADKEAIAGRLIRSGRDRWDEVSFSGGKQKEYNFRFVKRDQNRIFLEDISRPRRPIELEIDLDLKRIRWMDQRVREWEEIYRVLDTD